MDGKGRKQRTQRRVGTLSREETCQQTQWPPGCGEDGLKRPTIPSSANTRYSWQARLLSPSPLALLLPVCPLPLPQQTSLLSPKTNLINPTSSPQTGTPVTWWWQKLTPFPNTFSTKTQLAKKVKMRQQKMKRTSRRLRNFRVYV